MLKFTTTGVMCRDCHGIERKSGAAVAGAAPGSEALWQTRVAEIRRELTRIEARIDAEEMTGKIGTDNLSRLLNELEAAMPKGQPPNEELRRGENNQNA